jgi:hypothetical protein
MYIGRTFALTGAKVKKPDQPNPTLAPVGLVCCLASARSSPARLKNKSHRLDGHFLCTASVKKTMGWYLQIEPTELRRNYQHSISFISHTLPIPQAHSSHQFFKSSN